MKKNKIDDVLIVDVNNYFSPSSDVLIQLSNRKPILFNLKADDNFDSILKSQIGRLVNEYGYTDFIKIFKRYVKADRHLLIVYKTNFDGFMKDNSADYVFSHLEKCTNKEYDLLEARERVRNNFRETLNENIENSKVHGFLKPYEFHIQGRTPEQRVESWEESIRIAKEHSYEIIVLSGIQYNDGVPLGGIMCSMEDLGHIILKELHIPQWFYVIATPFINVNSNLTKELMKQGSKCSA